MAPQVFEAQRLDPNLPLFSATTVQPNPDFYGRDEELTKIDEHLLPTAAASDNPLRSFGICGMGGLGKTQIAVQYVYTRRTYFDAIFWLSADDKTELSQRFASIATQLGIEDDDEHQDLVVSRERVKNWLSHPLISVSKTFEPENEARWLMVFDNADDLSVLEDYWPKTGRGAVLITSRDPVAKTSLYTESRGVDLEKLTLDANVHLLRSLTKQTTDDDQGKSLRMIAEMLDGLPLGIEQMSSIIRQLRVSYSDFWNIYEKERSRLYAMTPQRKEKGYQHNLATVWSLQNLSEGSETFLQILSTLDPDFVPETIFIQHLDEVKLAGFPSDLINYYSSRGGLMGASLVSLTNLQQNQKVLRLHRLLQDVVRARMDDSRFDMVFEASINLISKNWPFQNLEQRHQQRDRWEKCTELFSQVSHLRKLAREVEIKNEKPLTLLTWIELLNDVGWYLFERGLIEEAQEFFSSMQTACEASEERESERVQYLLRECHNNQGTAANEANDFKNAVFHFEIWKDMCLKRRADNADIVEDYELGCVYHELAIAQAANGDYDSALINFDRTIQIWKALPEYKENMMSWPVSNLGFLYDEIGRWTEAEEISLKALDILTAEGDKSFRPGKIVHALGNIYASTGQMQKSLQYHLLAQAQYRKVLGDGHTRTAAACHRLADHYIRLKRFKEAEAMLDQALKVFASRKCTLNELARTTFKKSQCFAAQGDNAKAKQYQQEAYQMWRKVVKDDETPMEKVTENDYNRLIIFWNR